MAVNKNFVVKNGIEVATDLLFATTDLDKVGIGSTNPTVKLDVIGDMKVDDNMTVVGLATIRDDFDVGVGGTVITADISAGRVGLNQATPEYNVHISNVGSGSTSLYVGGGDLKVDGDIEADDIDLTGSLEVLKDLQVTGLSSFIDNLDINGDVDMDANLHLTGVSTFIGDIVQTGNLNITGVATISSDLTVQGDLNVTGDISYDEVTGRNISISGISTLGTVQISSGIVTATSGVVTYYGDGSNLTGVATDLTATIGIQSGGTHIGSGITAIDFTGTNASVTVAVPPDTAAGIATVNIVPSVSLGLVIALGA